MNLENLIRKNIQSLKPYSSARDDFKGVASVYLDANESPYPSDYNRYPDPYQTKLKARLAELKNVASKSIFVGNGSDEPIDLLYRAFCEPGVDQVIIPQPTYGMYQVSAGINNVNVIEVPLTDTFDLDVDAIKNSFSATTKILFLCSPNNPSGNVLTRSKIIQLLEAFTGLVVVDEAYIDFVNEPSFTTLLSTYQNLVVLQTLSKAWGLASLRIGLCMAHPIIVDVLNKIKPPYNISGLTQRVALDQLHDEQTKIDHVKQIISEREKLTTALSGLPMVINVYPSQANFVLAKFTEASKTYRQLMERGVIVRDRSSVLLCGNCLRISIGTPAENQTLLTTLRQL